MQIQQIEKEKKLEREKEAGCLRRNLLQRLNVLSNSSSVKIRNSVEMVRFTLI